MKKLKYGIPSEINLYGDVYKVELVDKRDMYDEDGCVKDGEVSDELKEIKIRNNMTRDLSWETFWHEVFHVVYGETGLEQLWTTKEEHLIIQCNAKFLSKKAKWERK